MKLIGSLTSPYVRKVRVVLAEKKIDCEFEIDSPWAEGSNVPNMNRSEEHTSELQSH